MTPEEASWAQETAVKRSDVLDLAQKILKARLSYLGQSDSDMKVPETHESVGDLMELIAFMAYSDELDPKIEKRAHETGSTHPLSIDMTMEEKRALLESAINAYMIARIKVESPDLTIEENRISRDDVLLHIISNGGISVDDAMEITEFLRDPQFVKSELETSEFKESTRTLEITRPILLALMSDVVEND